MCMVLNGVTGRLSLLYTGALGLRAHAYRTSWIFIPAGAVTTILSFPTILL